MILRLALTWTAVCTALSPILALGYYVGTHWQ